MSSGKWTWRFFRFFFEATALSIPPRTPIPPITHFPTATFFGNARLRVRTPLLGDSVSGSTVFPITDAEKDSAEYSFPEELRFARPT